MKKPLISAVLFFISFSIFSQTWTSQVSGITTGLNSMYFSDNDTGVVVGLFGKVLRTTSGGTNWNLQTSGTTSDLYAVSFATPLIGYAAGNNGTIIKTIDGGITWTALSSGTSTALRGLYFTSIDTGYTCGSSGTILKTTDGGATWATLVSGTSNTLYGISFFNLDMGYAVGINGTIIKTMNAGNAWSTLSSGTASTLFSPNFADSLNVCVSSSTGLILKTPNGGGAWLSQSIGSLYMTSVNFLNTTTGFVIGGDVGADTSAIFRTDDAGLTWVWQNSNASRLYGSYFTGFDAGYACGTNGTIVKVTAIKVGISENATLEFNASTFPNPFSSSFSVSFEVKKAQCLEIGLYDITGKEIMKLAERNFLQGTHVLQCGDLDLPQGSYFVQIRSTEGVQTQKIIKAQ